MERSDANFWRLTKEVGGLDSVKSSSAPDVEEIVSHFQEKMSNGKGEDAPRFENIDVPPVILKSWRVRLRKVWRVLSRLDPKKSSRGIARVFFKECAPVLAAPVCALYRYIVQRGKWPVEWKTGRATPVHKRGSKAEAKNYRPVMSLCAVSIAFEEVIYDQFEAWIDSFIPLDQFGFSKHCGTDDLCLCLGSKMMATLEVRGGGLMIPLDVKGVV